MVGQLLLSLLLKVVDWFVASAQLCRASFRTPQSLPSKDLPISSVLCFSAYFLSLCALPVLNSAFKLHHMRTIFHCNSTACSCYTWYKWCRRNSRAEGRMGGGGFPPGAAAGCRGMCERRAGSAGQPAGTHLDPTLHPCLDP